MKYDDCAIIESELRQNDNIIRNTKKKKIELIDIFIVQAVVCVIVSCGVMISRLL